MKINIKKNNKTKTFNLIKSWDDVTLDRWIELIKLEESGNTKEALETIKALSDIPSNLILKLALKDVAKIMERVTALQNEADSGLKRIIKVEGKEYGYHPDLSEITLGEWADLESLIEEGIQSSLPEVMAILYRPVVEKKNDAYIIEPYDGNIAIRAEVFKKMKANEVRSSLVFFWLFVKKCLPLIPLSLMETLTETRKQLEMILSQKSGDISD